MRRSLILFFILRVLAMAGVTCSSGTWTVTETSPTSSWFRGTCSGGTHPITYTVSNAGISNMGQTVMAVVNDAWLGDTIMFQAGETFSWGSSWPIITRRWNGTGKLLLTTTEHAKLPANGTRITPAYNPIMPEMRQFAASNEHGWPNFAIAAGPGSGDHIEFRGLHFTKVSAGPWPNDIGSINCPNIYMGSSNIYSGEVNYLTPVWKTALKDQKNVAVLTTDGFAVSNPPMRVAIAYMPATSASPSVAAANYWVVGVHRADDPDPNLRNTIDICYATQRTANYADDWAVDAPNCAADDPNRAGLQDNVLYNHKVWHIELCDGCWTQKPDDIVVRQNTFTNDGLWNIFLWAKPDTRGFTWRDNWSEIYGQIANEPEVKHLHTANGYGPYTFENNYFLGGMAIMYGGSASHDNTAFAGGSVWKYNNFALPLEQVNLGPWGVTMDSSSSYAYSQMSVPGLPAHSARFVWKGRAVCGQNTESLCGTSPYGPWWTATNTGVVGTEKPACFTKPDGSPVKMSKDNDPVVYCYDGDPARASYGSTMCGGTTYPGDGVCWMTRPGGNKLNTKNSWETKNSTNQLLQYNVFDGFPPANPYNTGQNAVINVKIDSSYQFGAVDAATTLAFPGVNDSGCKYDPVKYAGTGGYNRWPSTGRAAGYNIAFKNNWFKNIWGGLTLMGYYTMNGNGPAGGVCRGQEPQGKYNLTGNLIQFGKGMYSSASCIYINTNTDEQPWSSGNRLPITDVTIAYNTCYTPFTSVQYRAPIFLGQTGSSDGSWQNPTSGFDGKRVFEGNVIGRFESGTFVANYNGGSSYRTDSRFFDKWFPGTLREDPGVWRKNILLGAAQQSAGALAFPAGSVWTGCPGSSACVNLTMPPDYTKVFNNPGVDFRVKNDHPFKRSLDGADPGADPNQLPMIKGLTVQPTDRSVVFTWSLTPVIAHIPCVVELHTSPDLESTSYAGNLTGYAAELSNIGTYHGQDSDNTDRSYRDGNRRMLLLGHSVPLAANTAYFYRLHCGGDVAVGSFQTAAALSGTGTQTITHTAQRSATANMLVEYGTLYSRATDTISGGGTASATCVDGRCVVNFTATKGSMYYYRWKERAANNSVLLSGRVEVMPAF